MVANNVSEADIANFALTRLGAGRIFSLSDTSEQAIVMNLFYEHTRQACLSYSWQFARRRASLAELTETPAFEYTHQYALPSDFLRLYQVDIYYPQYNNSLVVSSNSQAYTIENNKILTNIEAPLKIMYTADIVDTTQFSPMFCRYFSLVLAHDTCEQLTQSNTKKEAIAYEIKEVLKTAAMIDKTQLPPRQEPTGAFIDSRIG